MSALRRKLFHFLFISILLCHSALTFARINFDSDASCQEVYEEFNFCRLNQILSKTKCTENILIRQYSDHLYTSLNFSIREKFPSDKYCKMINDVIFDYLARVGTKYTKSVFSGQELPEVFANESLIQDKCFQMGHYLSSSLSETVAKTFAQNLNTSFIMQFQSKSGVLIEDFAVKKDEHEVLFRPGMILQFKKRAGEFFYIPPTASGRRGDNPYPSRQYPREIPYLQFDEVLPGLVEKICDTKLNNIPVVYLNDMPH
ncbi:MAG: ADP-ribosyltransferase domain-containing protein [Bacteriovoracaceae bacterium]|nr:ADP-ribosyltransferase domain-containing protein [Bacteriovoracaceae bacterium]